LPQWRAAPLILSSIGGAVFLFAAELVAIWLPQSTARCPMAQLALLWQNLAIDWRNWIPESDFQ
jgi:hypothetical protein